MPDDKYSFLQQTHIFETEAGHLAFHPPSFSLFRLGPGLAAMLQDLKAGISLSETADRYEATEDAIASALQNISHRIEREQASVPVAPLEVSPRDREVAVTIHVSNACNLNCVYCYAGGGSYGAPSQSRMDKDLALKSVDAMYRNFPKIRSVMFFGGEPTLAMDVIESICKHIASRKERGEIEKIPQYSMVTNGTLLNDRTLEIIKRYKIALTVSVDGPQQIHDALRPYKSGKGSFDVIKKGFDRIVKEVGQVPQIEATFTSLHRDNGIDMKGLIDFLHKDFLFSVGTVAHVELDASHPLALSVDDSRKELCDTLTSLLTDMAEGKVPRLERSFLKPLLQFVSKTSTRFTCSVAYDSFTVATDGTIYPCQVFVGRPEFVLGNVDDFDMMNPSDQLTRVLDLMVYRDKHKNPVCKECWAKAFCLNCPGSHAFLSNGCRIPEGFCESMQYWVESILYLLYSMKKDQRMWDNFIEALKKLSEETRRQLSDVELLSPALYGAMDSVRTS